MNTGDSYETPETENISASPDNMLLPVIRIIMEAVALPVKNFSILLKYGAPFLIVYFPSVVFKDEFQLLRDPEASSAFVAISYAILLVCTMVMAAIGLHRVFLMNEADVKKTKIVRWSWREVKFLGWWLIFWVVDYLSVALISKLLIPLIFERIGSIFPDELLIGAVSILLYLPVIYVISRWALLLPDTAVDGNGNALIWSWKLSSGNGLRLTILVGVIPMLMTLLFRILSETNSIAISLIVNMIMVVVVAIEIALISLCYKYLTRPTQKAKPSSGNRWQVVVVIFIITAGVIAFTSHDSSSDVSRYRSATSDEDYQQYLLREKREQQKFRATIPKTNRKELKDREAQPESNRKELIFPQRSASSKRNSEPLLILNPVNPDSKNISENKKQEPIQKRLSSSKSITTTSSDRNSVDNTRKDDLDSVVDQTTSTNQIDRSEYDYDGSSRKQINNPIGYRPAFEIINDPNISNAKKDYLFGEVKD